MSRKEIKRLLALLKAQAEHPERNIKIKLPRGFKKSFEEQSDFRGWINYHVTWDVDKNDVWKVVNRYMSLVAEWHRELIKVVPAIHHDGTIVEIKHGSQGNV